jgi:hypothetical protein
MVSFDVHFPYVDAKGLGNGGLGNGGRDWGNQKVVCTVGGRAAAEERINAANAASYPVPILRIPTEERRGMPIFRAGSVVTILTPPPGVHMLDS